MSNVIQDLERAQLRTVPRFKAGDTVRVHFQVIEGSRRRVQVFEGIVIKRQGSGVRETFTVRRISSGVGVERTFPLHSPKIERVEVVAIGDVNRAKLYYLRGRVGKKARVRERRYGVGSELPQTVEATLVGAEDELPAAEETGLEEHVTADEAEVETEEPAAEPEESAAEAEGEEPEAAVEEPAVVGEPAEAQGEEPEAERAEAEDAAAELAAEPEPTE